MRKEEEREVLNTQICTFRTRKELKEFLEKYEIDYNKTIFNKTNIRRVKTIEELLSII